MVYDPTGRMKNFDPRSFGQLGSMGSPGNASMPSTGMDNPNQFLQNPPDFMSGGPHPMPNMPGQNVNRPNIDLGRDDVTIFNPVPGSGRPFDDVIGGERKPGPGYFNDLVNKGGPPLSTEMRRKINEMVGARPPTKVPDMPDMPGDAGRGGEPTPPSDSFNYNKKWNVDDTGVSVDTTDIYDAPYTVYNRYDPATDTYYGYTRNFAWGDGSKQPISMKGSEASQTFKDAWKRYEGPTGPSPTPSRPPLNIPDMPIPDIDDPLLPNPPPTGYGPDGETRMPMPDGFIPPPPGSMNTMALETFYNPTTGQEWTAANGGYTPGPGWVKGSKSQYEANNPPTDGGAITQGPENLGGPVPTPPETPATTDRFGQPLPRSPLDTLYGQIGVSDEAAARDVVNKILSGQTGDLTQAQRDLTGGGIYRRIANRLGMKDAAGNLITPFSSVQTESGNIATPEATQVFQSLLDMENLESGSGIELLLNHLRGRMRARPPMPQPQPGPFGLIPGRGGFGMPGMGGMYGGMYGMPRPPMFGSPYMSRMPFMNYAGMANPMNRSIFGGYGYGYGPGMGMAPLSYYGGYGGGMDPNIDGFKKYPIGYDYGSSNFMRPQRRMIE